MSWAPGVYDDVPEVEYHADKESLSSSGARALIESSPYTFRYRMDADRAPKKVFDHGHAAHSLVLGIGAPLELIPFDEWRSNACKALVAEARAAGAIPLKPVDYAQVHDMAAAIRENPLAAKLLSNGVAEQSIWWRDPETGVTLRARFDWRTTIGRAHRMAIVDYKSTADATPAAFEASAGKWGYWCQDPWYRDGAIAAGLDDDPAFIFIAQDKEPPYEATVHQYTAEDVALGRETNRRAIRIFARCIESGEWPPHAQTVHTMRVPTWTRRQLEEIEA